MSDKHEWFKVCVSCYIRDTGDQFITYARATSIGEAANFAKRTIGNLDEWENITVERIERIPCPTADEILTCIFPFLEEFSQERDIVAGYFLSTVDL